MARLYSSLNCAKSPCMEIPDFRLDNIPDDEQTPTFIIVGSFARMNGYAHDFGAAVNLFHYARADDRIQHLPRVRTR